MSVEKTIQRTLYTNRRYHQPLSGSNTGSIFDTSWSTVQNSPIFSNYVDGVNVGSFQVRFNDGQNNNALVHSNGNWIPPKTGYDCFINIIEVDTKGRITDIVISDGGVGYKVGDRFSIISLGAVNGLVEVKKTDSNGKVESVEIINGGMGYQTTTNIELNDLFWTLQEVLTNAESGEEIITNIINPLDQEWKLKLDNKNLTSFALYGNLVELIKASFLGIVNNFPASLWLLRKEYYSESILEWYYEVNNPFNINIFTSDEDPYIDDIRVFQQNHNRYEIIEAKNSERVDDNCIDDYTGIQLTENRYDIDSVTAVYKHIYIKKPGFIGFVGKIDGVDYTLDNNDLITIRLPKQPDVLTKQEVFTFDKDGNTIKENVGCVADHYYTPIRLIDGMVISYNNKTNIINILFNYDDKHNPCTLINYVADIDSDVFGFHIRPKEKYINDFFNNLSDFQNIILNRNTVPTYTSTFYVPMKDSDGSYTGMYTNEDFTLETEDGWNIDLSSTSYQRMMKTLLDAAEYMDTMKCDNIYRMLTHDSIKNLDWSLNRVEDEALAESHIIGGTFLKKVLRIYGRSYDEIKKYIRGIEVINNLTYNQLDNYPDAILKNEVDIAGWKPVSVINFDNFGVTTEQLYYGWQQKYNSIDIENEFYRRLLLNSSYIASWKGTKHGIEMLMNLFGIDRNKWGLNEIVYVANGSSYGPNKDTNDMIPDEVSPINSDNIVEGYTYDVYSSNPTGSITYNGIKYMSGQEFVGIKSVTEFTPDLGAQVYFYPFKNILLLNKTTPYTENGSDFSMTEGTAFGREVGEGEEVLPIPITKYYYGDYIDCKKCSGKGYTNERSICYQCNGLGKVRRYHGVPFFHGNTERLYYQQYGGWYQDTQAELRMVETIEDLKSMIIRLGQEEGTLVFVRNDSQWKVNDGKKYSNYWVLTDSDKSVNKDGWHNLTEDETSEPFTITTESGVSVTINIQAYFQITTTNEGNNPHTGGTLGYDYGNSYLQNIGYDVINAAKTSITPPLSIKKGNVNNTNGIFNYTLNNSPDCMWDKPQFYLLENVGFKLEGYVDNKGCWPVYRNEGYIRRKFVSEPKIYKEDVLMIDPSYSIYNTYTDLSGCTPKLLIDKETNTRYVERIPENTEFYRIVNCKNIVFRYNSEDGSEEYFFINNIMPYLENLIPSTSILDIAFASPTLCGIGVMKMREEDAEGDQCEEVAGDHTAINRVAKFRNVPNFS